MTSKSDTSTVLSGPRTSASAWGLRPLSPSGAKDPADPVRERDAWHRSNRIKCCVRLWSSASSWPWPRWSSSWLPWRSPSWPSWRSPPGAAGGILALAWRSSSPWLRGACWSWLDAVRPSSFHGGGREVHRATAGPAMAAALAAHAHGAAAGYAYGAAAGYAYGARRSYSSDDCYYTYTYSYRLQDYTRVTVCD